MVEQLFGSKTRVKLLRLFVNNPNRSFYVREITRKIDEQINSVRRELANLVSIGIIKSESQNNKLYYEVNQKSKFYEPMQGLFATKKTLEEAEAESKTPATTTKATKTKQKKTTRVAGNDGTNLVERIQKLGSVQLAILTGSFTRDTSVPVDILLVGSITKAKASRFISELEKEENRELTYVVLKRDEFDYRNDVNDRFLAKVMHSKKTVLVDEDNLA